MEGELDEFRYAFSQIGLDKTGTSDEVQYLTLRATDGVAGRFYQLVLSVYGEEKFWSFSEADDLLPLVRSFISMAEKIDEL
jgi:hypothetical protein